MVLFIDFYLYYIVWYDHCTIILDSLGVGFLYFSLTESGAHLMVNPISHKVFIEPNMQMYYEQGLLLSTLSHNKQHYCTVYLVMVQHKEQKCFIAYPDES